jgi:ribulose-5-phosphate 4-epimerase/fuculose-1-phosphate aldolase
MGKRLAGKRRVSSEIGMHLLIYRLRPDVQGIVHAHPPTATGFAASGYDLNRPLVCEVVVGLGSIPLARYGTPGTPELTDALEPLIPHHDAILMANHGVVTFGSSVESAYMRMETVEHFAKMRWSRISSATNSRWEKKKSRSSTKSATATTAVALPFLRPACRLRRMTCSPTPNPKRRPAADASFILRRSGTGTPL